MGVEFEQLTKTSFVDWSENYSGLSMREGAGCVMSAPEEQEESIEVKSEQSCPAG
jgi:hypothetical protein